MPTENEVLMNLIKQQQYENWRNRLLARNMAYADPNWQQQMTQLPPEQEAAFLQWVQANQVPFNPADKFPDYDMRGYYLSLQQGGAPQAGINEATQSLHFPDIYKTPYHESFSSESKWAKEGAPSWQDNRLIAPSGEVIFEDKPEQ